jgi:hypothetical protein
MPRREFFSFIYFARIKENTFRARKRCFTLANVKYVFFLMRYYFDHARNRSRSLVVPFLFLFAL